MERPRAGSPWIPVSEAPISSFVIVKARSASDARPGCAAAGMNARPRKPARTRRRTSGVISAENLRRDRAEPVIRQSGFERTHLGRSLQRADAARTLHLSERAVRGPIDASNAYTVVGRHHAGD